MYWLARFQRVFKHQVIRRHWYRQQHTVAFTEGDRMHGYVVQRVKEIPELSLTAVRLEHENTGADHLHIARKDKNNVFSVALKTLPSDSTGVAHILEHLSLCGSKKYPCRDPFFKMLTRSMATFMNAFTGSDFTMYPFSTQNPKDFQHLLQVYLDAVFSPLLLETDFRQEGWRIEHENPLDQQTPLVLKGVVYNEMKGVFSSSANLFLQNVQTKLFPSNTYSHVSGGDPKDIPNLTWDDLKSFHQKHYHPSNSRFFTYGDIPLESHLAAINELVLSKYSKSPEKIEVADEIRWNEKRESLIYCQPDPLAPFPDRQTSVCNAYLLDRITNKFEPFALQVLALLLCDGPSAPFYRALLESGLGMDFVPNVGYDGHTKQASFLIGVQGVQSDQVIKVKEIMEETFHNVLRDGFPQERVEAILHSVELNAKHQPSNFGLTLNMILNSVWNHGGDPVHLLQVNEHLNWFRSQLRDNPTFLQDKVKELFLENPHCLSLTMMPKEEFEQERQLTEKEQLQKKTSKLTPSDRQKIYQAGIELLEFQKKPPDVSCLPTLLISDIPKEVERVKLKQDTVGGVRVQQCEQPTNEVIYFNAVFTSEDLPRNLKPYLPLFCSVVTKLGAGKRNHREFDQEVSLKTGGLNVDVHISDDPAKLYSYEEGIVLSSHCLEKNVESMFSLWNDVIHSAHFDNVDYLIQLIRETASELSQVVIHRGHTYVMRNSSASLSPCAKLKEEMSGLTHVAFLKSLAELQLYDDVVGKLKMIADIVFNKKKLRCALNAQPSSMEPMCTKLENLITSISSKECCPPENETTDFNPCSQLMHHLFPCAVNYLGKSFLTVPYTHKDYAHLQVASKLLSSRFLLKEIREQGGAYGGGSVLSSGGLFHFYSYRDPNVSRTMDAFTESIKWLCPQNVTQQDLDEAKLAVFQDMDHPLPPGQQGLKQFLHNLSDDMRQSHRERVFDTTLDDIVLAVSRYLSEDCVHGISLLGPETDVTKSNKQWALCSF